MEAKILPVSLAEKVLRLFRDLSPHISLRIFVIAHDHIAGGVGNITLKERLCAVVNDGVKLFAKTFHRTFDLINGVTRKKKGVGCGKFFRMETKRAVEVLVTLIKRFVKVRDVNIG